MLRASFVSLIGVLATGAASAADAPPAAAPQAAPPPMKLTLVRGTVESVSAAAIVLKPDSGADVTAAVTPKTRFATVEKRTLAQIRPQDFVGITAVPGEGDHLRAEEVHIIPVVGMGEGQYPWDHHPTGEVRSSMGSMTNGTVTAPAPTRASSMTNGTVTAGAAAANQLTVSYHGSVMVGGKCEGRADPAKPACVGTAIVDVPADAAIAAIVAGTPADVKPGLAMVAAVAEDAAGHTFLGSITVEKNGVKPEF